MIVEKDVKPKQHTHTTTTSWMPSFVELLLVDAVDQMDHGTFNALDELKVAIVMAKMVCSIRLLSHAEYTLHRVKSG